MKYISTARQAPAVPIDTAIVNGLAPDGGLYIPSDFPEISWSSLNQNSQLEEIAYHILLPFFKGGALEKKLKTICEKAFNFPLLLTELDRNLHLLELYHGPTAAFKDFGARFLAQCFSALEQKITILVATSGDTGGAVASAFYKTPNTKVVVLFPRGGVSQLQETQLTCWGENILSLKVDGDFDSCQALVKEAFQNPDLKKKYNLTSCNSINIGRLLPQMVYYAYSSLQIEQSHYYIPVGNLGNALAALWTRQLGAAIGPIHLVSNDNRTIPEAFASGQYQPRPSKPTLANAMDVGAPSNMERLIQQNPNFHLDESLSATHVDDENIRQGIRMAEKNYRKIICPHTATAYWAYTQSPGQPAIIASTADPAKFADIVEPIISRPLEMPESLQTLQYRKTGFQNLKAEISDLEKTLEDWFKEN